MMSSLLHVWVLVATLLCQIRGSFMSAATDGVSYEYGDGSHGPAHWGDMKAAWSVCKTGMAQSPLCITPETMVADHRLGTLDAKYSSKPVPATISHDGHVVEVKVPRSAGVSKIRNVIYQPVQMHFHMPSEHKILNHSFPLELHLVHLSKEGRIAVIAWLFAHGEDSPFLAQFIDKLPSHEHPNVHTEIGPIKLPKLERSYGRYQGSLTTPPCLETVTWTVMLWNFPTVSQHQLKLLKIAMPKENARPSVPSHGRQFRINFSADVADVSNSSRVSRFFQHAVKTALAI